MTHIPVFRANVSTSSLGLRKCFSDGGKQFSIICPWLRMNVEGDEEGKLFQSLSLSVQNTLEKTLDMPPNMGV